MPRKGPRQGDVLFVPVATVQGDRIRPVKRRYTVAEGELTGHSHTIKAGPNVAAFLSRDGMFLDSHNPSVHQEHTPAELDGEYQVVLQRRASDHEVLPVTD